MLTMKLEMVIIFWAYRLIFLTHVLLYPLLELQVTTYHSYRCLINWSDKIRHVNLRCGSIWRHLRPLCNVEHFVLYLTQEISHECLGSFLGIIGRDLSVFKFNILHIHNNIMWDLQYSMKYSHIFLTFKLNVENTKKCGQYFEKYCQSHRMLLWM